MKYIIQDKPNRFLSFFDTDTGTYIRSGVLDKSGNDTGVDPFMATFPHLIDVGIMGRCIHGRIGLCEKTGTMCYQNGASLEAQNISIDDFKWIVEQCKGRTYQFALGGRGDPDQHEHFEELLQICRENMIVPNFTTSGYRMTAEIAAICKKYCGAVAVSWYRKSYTIDAIKFLIEAGVKTNIHYILSKDSVDEAIMRLQQDDFPKFINAVVFLLYKPVKLGTSDHIITAIDKRMRVFYEELRRVHPFRIGLDSCNIPGYINLSQNIDVKSFDTCEGARYSCYIGSDMVMTPCSFDQKNRYSVQLRPITIEEAWNMKKFEAFRRHLLAACPNCEKRSICMGGCPLIPEIVLCNRLERLFPENI
ncbi:MAG: radical SAM protein [Eubacteriales bacterium]